MKLETIVMIENCVSIICFTILSIVFQLWWIILFSILFLKYVEQVDRKR